MVKAALIVLVIHGGGWNTGKPSDVPVFQGVPSASINYTLHNYPQAVADVRAWVRVARTRYRHVALYGHSAGGTLAAFLAARGEVDAAVVEDAPIDLTHWATSNPYFWRDVKLGSVRLRRAYSPIARVQNPAPILGVYADHDNVVPLRHGRSLARNTGARLVVRHAMSHRPTVRLRPMMLKFIREAVDR